MKPAIPLHVNIRHNLAPQGSYSIVTVHDRLGNQLAIFHDASTADYLVKACNDYARLEEQVVLAHDKIAELEKVIKDLSK